MVRIYGQRCSVVMRVARDLGLLGLLTVLLIAV